MVDILHRVGVQSAPDDAYAELTTREGLSGWWTKDTQGDGEVGGVLQFRFDAGGFHMKVLDQQPDKRVLWEVVDGPKEWVGTHVSFELKQEGDNTIILFRHEGWQEPVEFMHHCSTKWAMFLMSLKSLLETETAPRTRETSRSTTGTETGRRSATSRWTRVVATVAATLVELAATLVSTPARDVLESEAGCLVSPKANSITADSSSRAADSGGNATSRSLYEG